MCQSVIKWPSEGSRQVLQKIRERQIRKDKRAKQYLSKDPGYEQDGERQVELSNVEGGVPP